eukprot:363164-Pleurochrysis_carterae.AAC.1
MAHHINHMPATSSMHALDESISSFHLQARLFAPSAVEAISGHCLLPCTIDISTAATESC